LLLGVTGWKSFRSALPKTTLPFAKSTTVTVERVIPFEHPFPNRQTQSASTLLNETKRIRKLRDRQRGVRLSREQCWTISKAATGHQAFNRLAAVRERHYLYFASRRRALSNILPVGDKPDLIPTRPGTDVPRLAEYLQLSK